jgi:hypothetical protein
MTKTNTNQQEQDFYNYLTNYTFFIDGRLDFYRFCVMFSECLTIDKKITVNNPNVIAQLLLEMISESPESATWVSKKYEKQIPKESYHIYPNGELILIHVSAWVMHIHQFIWELGHSVLEVEHTDNERYFAYWLTSKDVFTHAFLDKLFAEIRELTKSVDTSGSLKAQLQNMSLTKEMELGITDNLMSKDDISGIAVERISKAIADSYFLEAVTLQESIISDRLALFLHHQGNKSDSKTLNKLILSVQKHHKHELFEKIDIWRGQRNKAIHGLVRSSPFDNLIGLNTFDELAKETAIEGEKLVIEIVKWFDEYVYEKLNVFQITPYDVYRGNQERLSS